MIVRDILLTKPIFWIPTFRSSTRCYSKLTITYAPLEVVF